MKKRIISLFLVFILMAGLLPMSVSADHINPCPSKGFVDVPGEANWAHEGIDYCIANGYMNGLSKDTFGPGGTVTRAQLVTILYRIAESPKVDFKGTFTDVPKGQWYSDAIEWAADNDIVNGIGGGKFNPMGKITREQIATVLYRYCGSPAIKGNLSKFPDYGTTSSYATDALLWATRVGLINGIETNGVAYLSPRAFATRAQIASIMMRFILNKDEPIPEFHVDVGISIPTASILRWDRDSMIMMDSLEARGYSVEIDDADNDPAKQCEQIEDMIDSGAKVLIIVAIDSEALEPVLQKAEEAGCSVIAYDRFMGCSGVSYYVTFDDYMVGILQGKYIEQALDLEHAGDKKYNIEFITGDPEDYQTQQLYTSAMSVLEKYLDSGTLVCQSGQTSMLDAGTEGWNSDLAQERFEYILSIFYANKHLDAVLASNDSTAIGVALALSSSYSNDVYPIITGKDCDIVSVMNIVDGNQAMSVFKDTRDLTAKAVEMAVAILCGQQPPVNDNSTYDNGTGIIPGYVCMPKVCTAENYKELLIDSGYYSVDDLFWWND